MTVKKHSTDLTSLLLERLGQADLMFHMLEWLCDQPIEAEVSSKLGTERVSKVRLT